MPKRDRDGIELPILGCPCGYTVPPPWHPLNAAEHQVMHLQYLDVRRTVANKRATLADARRLCHAQQRLIDELHALAGRLRGSIADLELRVVEIEAELGDRRQVTT